MLIATDDNVMMMMMQSVLCRQSMNGHWWLGGLLVERRTSVSQIRGSIPRQVAAV